MELFDTGAAGAPGRATPLAERMRPATLDEFVKLDLPFLMEERTNRVAALKEIMGRADVSTSENAVIAVPR
jgi:hypothetical protein